ncbi:MAG: RimK family alpha-L-glutamate ligase [Gammaproteobacteria bacterium]|nr:RimK family alpha-L-glutamate ligase [Gammaproteobacteria bacterium]
MTPRLVIFTDEPGWHGRELRRWFGERGFAAEFVSLTACHVDLAGGGPGLVIPGFDAALPVGAFVRGVPGGSLEAITLRLDYLHLLEALGCPVFNSGRVIERTVDKAMTSLLLRHHGVPTPETFVSESLAAARDYVAGVLARGDSLVKKPLFGSQGKGLRRIQRVEDLGYLLPGEVIYLQQFVHTGDGPFRDCRVMVVDGRAIAAMERYSHHWITNRAQGAACRSIPLQDGLAQRAEAAAAAVGASYAGVDLLRDPAGQWLVTEVNGIPAWQGLQRATGVDVTALLGAACVARLEGGLAALA